MNDKDGLVLTRAELLTLLDAVDADDLVGVDSDALLPDDPKEHADLVQEGIEKLKGRGLLEVVDDVNTLNPTLFAVIQDFAHPDLVVLIRKQVPDLGEQRIMYYQRGTDIVEHTMPETEQFRFAVIPNTLAMINRIELFVPVEEGAPASAYQETLEQKAYIGVRWLVDQGRPEEAETILNDEGFPEGPAHLLVQALASYEYAAALAFLRIEDGQVVGGREMEVIRTNELTWLAVNAATDESQTVVKTTHREEYLPEIFDLLRGLIQQA